MMDQKTTPGFCEVCSLSFLPARQKRPGAQGVLPHAEQLSLTAEQEKEIRKTLSQTVRKYRQTSVEPRSNPELPAILAGIRKTGQDEALRILTPGQREVWERLDSTLANRKKSKNEISKRSLIILKEESLTRRDDFPELSVKGDIAMLPDSERHTFRELSEPARPALGQKNPPRPDRANGLLYVRLGDPALVAITR